MAANWINKPLGEIIPALRSGAVTASALFDEACEAHEKHGPALSAYRVWDPEHAREQAEAADAAFRAGKDHGPLQGIPVSVKDLFGVDYFDTFAGSPAVLPEKWNRQGPVIEAVRAGGAVLTGKTHMVEFAFGGLGANPHWPVPRNPWDAQAHRIPGGSSSGAGVGLIEGSCLIALGSDTAGSVRVPASVTGTVGMKVTAGRWPLGGIVPLSPTFDTPGVLARTAADAAIAFEIIDAHCAGRKPRTLPEAADIAGLRIGIVERHFWDDCSPGIAEGVRTAVSELGQEGATIVSIDLPEVDEAYDLFRHGSVVSSELRAFLESELPDWIETMDPNVAHRMASSLDLDDPEIARRRARIAEIAGSAEERLREMDVLVSPTVPLTAPALASVQDRNDYAAANLPTLSNTCIANILDLCAITLPVALDAEGIPVGLQVMAAGGSEERLLSLALAFEEKLGTGRQRLGAPPLVS